MCDTHCFSTKSMVARMHLNVMSYTHCLSCYYLPLMKAHLINVSEIHFKLNGMWELYLFYLHIFVLNIKTWSVLQWYCFVNVTKTHFRNNSRNQLFYKSYVKMWSKFIHIWRLITQQNVNHVRHSVHVSSQFMKIL